MRRSTGHRPGESMHWKMRRLTRESNGNHCLIKLRSIRPISSSFFTAQCKFTLRKTPTYANKKSIVYSKARSVCRKKAVRRLL